MKVHIALHAWSIDPTTGWGAYYAYRREKRAIAVSLVLFPLFPRSLILTLIMILLPCDRTRTVAKVLHLDAIHRLVLTLISVVSATVFISSGRLTVRVYWLTHARFEQRQPSRSVFFGQSGHIQRLIAFVCIVHSGTEEVQVARQSFVATLDLAQSGQAHLHTLRRNGPRDDAELLDAVAAVRQRRGDVLSNAVEGGKRAIFSYCVGLLPVLSKLLIKQDTFHTSSV